MHGLLAAAVQPCAKIYLTKAAWSMAADGDAMVGIRGMQGPPRNGVLSDGRPEAFPGGRSPIHGSGQRFLAGQVVPSPQPAAAMSRASRFCEENPISLVLIERGRISMQKNQRIVRWGKRGRTGDALGDVGGHAAIVVRGDGPRERVHRDDDGPWGRERNPSLACRRQQWFGRKKFGSEQMGFHLVWAPLSHGPQKLELVSVLKIWECSLHSPHWTTLWHGSQWTVADWKRGAPMAV